MKVFFDTNVYVAEVLTKGMATRLVASTQRAGWRIFYNDHVLTEVDRVLRIYKQLPAALAIRTRRHIERRASFVVTPVSRHVVPDDPADTPILAAAVSCRADYLVTNDQHLLRLHPYEGMRIIAMNDYVEYLRENGLLLA